MLDATTRRDIEHADAEATAMISFEIGKDRLDVADVGLRQSLQTQGSGSGKKGVHEKGSA